MSIDSNQRLAERESTDGSLQTERDQTDDELARRRAATDLKADQVLDLAGEHADEVVQTARDLADETAEPPTPAEARKLTDERAGEDEAVHVERARAEESLRLERQERKRALAGLLRLEREATDEHLLVERGRSDSALSARDDFLAMVSHDLRTLLGGIALAAELLDREAPRDQTGRTSVRARAETIQRSVARMNRLIGDLIDIASIEAGKFAAEPVRQDLAALVREAVETFELAAAASRVSLVIEDPAGPPVLALLDRDRILQVLANLLSNAIKFSDRGSRITATVAIVEGGARCSISNRGPAIPAAQLETIFERFWQVEGAGRRGLGLGLYISRCILQSHGGRIWAECAAAAGTTFFFTLPLA